MFRLITRLSLLVSLANLPLRSTAFRTSSYSTCTGVANSVRKSNLDSTTIKMSSKAGDELPKTEEGWRTVLNPEQFRVLRQKSTEPSGFSERTPGQLEFELKKTAGTKYPKEGTFDCVACGSPLYTAQSKFDSGCGWPAFYEGVPGAIKEIKDAGISCDDDN